MNDLGQHAPEMDEFDGLLRRTLGSATLTAGQRERHLHLLAKRAMKQSAVPRVRLSAAWLAPAGIALALMLALIAGVWLREVRLNPANPISVDASVRLLSAPQPGRGRHIVVERETGFVSDVLPRQWISDVWQRTLSDGTEQLSVEGRSETGAPLGSYVQNGASYRVVEFDGTVEQGRGKPLGVSPAVADVMISPDALHDELLGMLTNGGATKLSEVRTGSDEVTTLDVTSLIAGSDDRLQSDLGISSPIRQGLIEIAVDRKTGQLHSYREMVVDGNGTSHLVWAYTISTWDDLSASDVDASHFAIPSLATPTTTSP
jgi:hypothetical protein